MNENEVVSGQNVGTAQFYGYPPYGYPGYGYPGVGAAQFWWGPGSFLFPFLLGALLF